MKKICLGIASLAALIGSPALAADMAVKAPPVVWSWTGFYLGINGGGAWGHTAWQYTTAPFNTANQSSSGGIFGGTIGYNWQVDPRWVLGVEGDVDWARINGSTACPSAVFSCQSQIKAPFGTARGRVGWTWDRVMLYGTAGGAWSNVTIQTVNSTGPNACTNGGTSATCGTTNNRFGWTAGAGVEAMLWWSLSGKVEWLYYDLGSGTYGVDGGLFVNARETGNMVRAGLNWHFN